MLFNEKKHEFEIDGKKCTFSTGKFARKSQVAVYATMGGTVVLATVNLAEAKEDAAWFPLRIEYMEKMYAAGVISSSRFVKRERFPGDDTTLKGRIIDRSLRPRFPGDYRDEVLIIVKVLAYDAECEPMLLAVNAVSAALMLSKAPFVGPVSGVCVGMKDNEFMPLYKNVNRRLDKEVTEMNLVLAGDGERVNNIDADMFEVSEERVYEGMEYGLDLMKPWLAAQNEFVSLVAGDGAIEKSEYRSFKMPEDLVKAIETDKHESIKANIGKGIKFESSDLAKELFTEYEGQHGKNIIGESYEQAAKHILQQTVMEDGVRVDGRAFDEIREVISEVKVLPEAVHGSALFTRGMTQILTIATLATNRKKQLVEDMTGEKTRGYLHYYEDAPFVYGEVGRVNYVSSRRAIGHGTLAEKALWPVMPSEEEFPYMIVLVSEILSEHGSSSMGSVCGSTLALMDAGVPIKKPVGAIAVGLVADMREGHINVEKYHLLTDMFAEEDFYGLMDFKVAGTADGITAIQMDTKTLGLPMEIVKEAFEKTKLGRMSILENMKGAIPSAREQLSESAPHVESLSIAQDKIGELIGPGGKNIKNINETSGAEINVEDDGSVFIYGSSDAVKKAKVMVQDSVFQPAVGDKFTGKVIRIEDYGAFVEIRGGTIGLVHVSKLSSEFVKDVRSIVNIGDEMDVEVIGLDKGKVQLQKVT